MKIIIIIILFILLIGQLFIPFHFNFENKLNFKEFFNDDNIDLVRSITLTITATVSLLNLVFVYFFFFYERKRQKRQNELERKSFWYRKLLVEQSFSDLKTVFDDLSSEATYYKDRDELKYLVRTREGFRKAKNQIMTIYDFIRIMDTSFYEKLFDNLLIFEDEFMTYNYEYYTNDGKNLKDLIDLIKDQKHETLSHFFTYEKNGYSIQKDSRKLTKILGWLKAN